MKSSSELAKEVGLVILAAIMAGLALHRYFGESKFSVGDCLTLPEDHHTYKVLQVGQYSLRTIAPNFNSYEEYVIRPKELKEATKTDCYTLFDDYGTPKENK